MNPMAQNGHRLIRYAIVINDPNVKPKGTPRHLSVFVRISDVQNLISNNDYKN